MTIPPGPFAAQPSFRAAGERAARALAAGHACVVLLGEPAETDALLGVATAALAADHAVLHAVPPERFSATDLVRPGEGGILVVAGAERLGPPALRALDAHLRREPRAAPRAQLLLAATVELRDRTAFPDFATLHRASLLVDPPLLAANEQAALLTAAAPGLGAGRSTAWVRLAGGDATLLLALARRGPIGAAILRAASSPTLARALGRPLSLALLSCVVLAASLLIPRAMPERPPASPQGAPDVVAPQGAPDVIAPQDAPDVIAPQPAPGAGASPSENIVAASPPPPATASDDGASVERDDPGTAPPDDGVMVDHENSDQVAAESAAHAPRMVAARPGETLAAMYARVYRGIAAPPAPAAVDAVNPFPPQPGLRLVFPAPRAGWPRS